MTRRSGAGAAFPRVALAVVVAIDLISFFFFIRSARSSALADGFALDLLADVFSRASVSGAVVAAGLGGAGAFGRRPGRLWAGLLALGSLTLLSTVHTHLFGTPWRHLFFSGLCLAGWLVGLTVRRFQGAPEDESYARIGAMALLGAAYLNSGISKVVYGGSEWMSGHAVQTSIVGQDGLVPDGLANVYRSWIVTTPAVASFFSIATTGFELAGPLMLMGRGVRLLVVLGLVGMHANIYVLTTHILYWESMVLLLAFGLSPDVETSDSGPADGSHGRAFAAGAGLLALCAVVAIGHQVRRHHLQDVPREELEEGPVLEPTRAPLRQVGPFAVGQTIANAWSVDSLDVRGAGFVIALSGEPGLASFEITCAASPARSPFDVGPAHIFYPNNVEFRHVEPLGRALQERVRAAAEGQDICKRLESWRAAALVGRPE